MAERTTNGLRTMVRVMDDLLPIPGTRIRFGLDPILGLLPVGGDVAGAIVAGVILLAAARRGASPAMLARMGGNIAIDTIVGSIPLLGDLFDFGWKANRRNIELLERFQREPTTVRRSSRLILVLVMLALLLVLVGLGVLGFLMTRAIVRAI